MNFYKVVTKIFSFLSCSFLGLKQLFTILKTFQHSIFPRNTILLEIIMLESKQKPSNRVFTSSLINYWIKIFQKRMKVYLWMKVYLLHLYLSNKCFSEWFVSGIWKREEWESRRFMFAFYCIFFFWKRPPLMFHPSYQNRGKVLTSLP